jgi:tetratricopeptide (TPR) repeat protein
MIYPSNPCTTARSARTGLLVLVGTVVLIGSVGTALYAGYYRPSCARRAYEQGKAHLERGEYEQALAAFEGARDFFPESALFPDVGGKALEDGKDLLERGEADRAIEALNCALRLASEPSRKTEIYVLRSQAYQFKDDNKESLEDLGQAIEMTPGNPVSYFNRAALHLNLGDAPSALADYTTVLKLNPNLIDAYQARAELYAAMQQWEKAAADFEACRKREPNDEWAWNRLARVYLQLGRNSDYDKLCEQMLAQFGETLDPDTAGCVVWTCVLRENTELKKVRLVALARVAAQAEEHRGDHLQCLGAAQVRMGQFKDYLANKRRDAAARSYAEAAYKEAIGHLEEALTLAAADDKVWKDLFLAIAHARLNNAEQARQALQAAKKWIAEQEQGLPKGDKGDAFDWMERVELKLLAQEAEREVQRRAR